MKWHYLKDSTKCSYVIDAVGSVIMHILNIEFQTDLSATIFVFPEKFSDAMLRGNFIE